MLVRLAWRNLGRNPRRTGLTAAAGVFAAFLTILSLAMAKGSHERWIDDSVRLFPGHFEVSLDGYREHGTLDYGMTLDPEARRGLDELPRIQGWAPRLETWALAMPDREGSAGRAAWLVGLDPLKEGQLTKLGGSVSAGRFVGIEPERQVVLGEALARNLGVEVGDSVILIAADYYGSQSADRFEVIGTLSVGDPQFDSYSALLDLGTLREFLDVAANGLSHVAVFVADSDAVPPLGARLAGIFPLESYEVLSWEQLIPDVVQLMLLDDVGAWLSVGILIVVIGFGMLNTVLMSVYERVREFGVLRALGMRPRAIFTLVMLESVQLSLLGIVIGLALVVPLTLWLEQSPIPLAGETWKDVGALLGIEPVIEFSLSARQLIGTPLVLILVALLAALPPALRAARGRPVDALRET